MQNSPVLEQPFSRLRYEAGPPSVFDADVAGVQSREHCTALPAGAGQQDSERVTRSLWPQWAAHLNSDPSTAPARPGTSDHTGQPASAHGPPRQPAQGQGYMQLPLVSSRHLPGTASASVQRPEQARTPYSQGLTGQRPHQSTCISAELAHASSTWQRMAPSQQPAGAVAAPDSAPQHGAFSGAAPAFGRPVRAPQSSTHARPGCGQQTASPVIWPALPAGDIRRLALLLPCCWRLALSVCISVTTPLDWCPLPVELCLYTCLLSVPVHGQSRDYLEFPCGCNERSKRHSCLSLCRVSIIHRHWTLSAGQPYHHMHGRASISAAQIAMGASAVAPHYVLMQTRRLSDPTMLYHNPFPAMRDAPRPGISPTELW